MRILNYLLALVMATAMIGGCTARTQVKEQGKTTQAKTTVQPADEVEADVDADADVDAKAKVEGQARVEGSTDDRDDD
jgi:hypothetical protein